MLSYVYLDYFKSKVIYWEYQNGIKKQLEGDMPLYFYMEDKDGEYKTIFGKPAKKFEFTRWKEYKQKRDQYRDFNMKLYESDISLQTKFIANNYLGTNLEKPKQFNIFFVDIEVHLDIGFPRPEDAEGKVTLITIYSSRQQKFFIFSEKDFDEKFLIEKNKIFEKRLFNSEERLLSAFIDFIYYEHPDILTGWNSQDYDVPYIINRCKKILGDESVLRLSPVGHIREEEVRDKKSGVIKKQYFISGINCIDLMEVYKNYAPSQKPSYALNNIAKEEIGEGKLEYKGTISDLYKDWQNYVEYNIQDVELLVKLDNKLNYIDLLISFCYGCKVPFEHYSKTTRVLDGAFTSQLIKDNIVLPDVNRKLIDAIKMDTDEIDDTINNKSYVGGYVREPEKGLHEWVTSFDATSLYPSIMMGWNISPETKMGTIDENYVENVYSFLNGINIDDTQDIQVTISNKTITTNIKKICTLIKDNNYCLASNGTFYKQNKIGIVPKFVKEWFDKRKENKKKMLENKAKGNKELEKKYDLLQYNFKILINSVYGFLGSRYSRLYDVDNARAVTMTGQNVLKKTINRLNNFFSDEWERSEFGKSINARNFTGFVIYGDTDSTYLSNGKLFNSTSLKPASSFNDEELNNIKKEYSADDVTQDNDNVYIKIKDKDRIKTITHEIKHESIINTINKKIEPFIQDLIDEEMNLFTKKNCNCKINTISFKRESICRSAVFVEKKKYAAWILNDEGNVPVDKLKVTGLEIVRANTPKIAKTDLSKIVKDMLVKMDREYTVNQLKNTRDKFLTSIPEDIAFNSPVNGLEKYKDKYKDNNEEFKQTPIHVRGAIIYNDMLKQNKKLQNKYDFIYTGDKTKVLYMTIGEKWNTDVLSFKGNWISELNIDQYIDREKQFDKSVLSLMSKLFTLFKWELPNFNHHSWDDIFG